MKLTEKAEAELNAHAIRPFSCGSQDADWQSANCDKCIGGNTEDEDIAGVNKCVWGLWLLAACWGYGEVSKECADAIGINEKTARRHNWPCRAFRCRETGKSNDDRLTFGQKEEYGWQGAVDGPRAPTEAERDAILEFTSKEPAVTGTEFAAASGERNEL